MTHLFHLYVCVCSLRNHCCWCKVKIYAGIPVWWILVTPSPPPTFHLRCQSAHTHTKKNPLGCRSSLSVDVRRRTTNPEDQDCFVRMWKMKMSLLCSSVVWWRERWRRYDVVPPPTRSRSTSILQHASIQYTDFHPCILMFFEPTSLNLYCFLLSFTSFVW